MPRPRLWHLPPSTWLDPKRRDASSSLPSTQPEYRKLKSNQISLSIKANDELDQLISDKFARYVAVRADQFDILRRKPLKVKL